MEEKNLASISVFLCIALSFLLLALMLGLFPEYHPVIYFCALVILIFIGMIITRWGQVFIRRRSWSVELDSERGMTYFLEFPPGSFEHFEDETNTYFLVLDEGRLALRYAPKSFVLSRVRDGDEKKFLTVSRSNAKWGVVELTSASKGAAKELE